MGIETLAKKVAVSLQALVMVLGVSSASVAAVTVSSAPVYALASDCNTGQINGNADSDPLKAGTACSQGGSQRESLFGQGGIFTVIANTLIFIVGAISVIYLIIGGLRYVTSGGDSKAVTTAKDTILYAIVGIVVAVISFALVQFVVNALSTAS
ncbi:MAG TPA: hypothetical protein VMT30_00575 [Candidatus Saccharimonadia bacterium]|nr:hypothetical protein [Candidatus Saccharimonadia bacterium]